MKMKIHRELDTNIQNESIEYFRLRNKYLDAFQHGTVINENGKDFIVTRFDCSEGGDGICEISAELYEPAKQIKYKKYTFEDHQKLVQRTRNNNETELPNYALGLVCEAGEFGDMVKKHLYQGHKLDIDKCAEELGDVLWYLANICNVLDIDLAEVAKGNVEKLKKRYPEGFSKNDSVKRVDVNE